VQEFRYIVEPEAAALAAARRTEEQMEEISRACREMGEATSLRVRTEADTRFHTGILRATGNELLVPLGVLIESGFDYLFSYITRSTNDLDYAQRLHEDIERQIRLQRPEKARAAVRKLLANTDDVIGGGTGARPIS
jgi:DNA-binding FadR family transcriptional regulator